MQYPSLSTPTTNPPTGSVLVIGGGVAGVQAALDLTQLGLKVYLVEKSAAIGGVMARLDKTFPTNDCSLCLLAPKLLATGRDANIDILHRRHWSLLRRWLRQLQKPTVSPAATRPDAELTCRSPTGDEDAHLETQDRGRNPFLSPLPGLQRQVYRRTRPSWLA